MSNAIARQDSYQYLRIFEDVVSLILNNYVEEVNVDKVMHGAMHGLADGLDPDSAYLDAAQVKVLEKGDLGGPGQTGVELTRQYYLRVIAARDGSPAAKAGLMPGDYIRAIDGQSTRDTSVYEGQRLLRGKPGTQGASDGAARQRRRTARDRPGARRAAGPRGEVADRRAGRRLSANRGVRQEHRGSDQERGVVTHESRRQEPDHRRARHGVRRRGCGPRRGAAVRQERHARLSPGSRPDKEAIAAGAGDGTITTNAIVLTDNGTSNGAEVFAAALSGNKRATLIGERTLGRAARQKLVRLPDGSALMLTHLLYLTPASVAIHEKGLTPDVAVEQPDVDFGQPPPAKDATLDKAIESLTVKAAA